MGKGSCVLYPEAKNGKPSKLYRDLLKFTSARPLANALYASYIASNIADQMDNSGLTDKDSNDEHKLKDFLNFIHYNDIRTEYSTFSDLEKQSGAKDANGNRINYTDAKEALDKAEAFNDTHKGTVANVYQYGDVWGIVLSHRDSRTIMQSTDVKERLKAWDLYKQVFNSVGIDIENAPDELKTVFSAYNKALVQELQNLKRSSIQYLNRKQALTLFFLNSNSAPVQRLVASFGSMEDAAQAIDDYNRGTPISLSAGQKTLLKRAVAYCTQFNGIDIDALQTQVSQITTQTVTNSPEQAIQNELHRLNKKYGIDVNEIHKTNDRIDTLSEAATEAAIQLKREIDRIKEQDKGSLEEKRKDDILHQLMVELASKKYYSGILSYLRESGSAISNIQDLIKNTQQTGSDLDKAFAAAKTLQDIKSLKDRYYPLLSALVNPNLIIDESISNADIANFRREAQHLKDYFDLYEKDLVDLTYSTMSTIMVNVFGDTTADGRDIINALNMVVADSTAADYLYSMGRVSSPILNAMGTIIRKAQEERNAKMNQFSLRIRRATDKLYKSGSDSSFMYEDESHIISDIDWAAFKSAKNQFIKVLKTQHLSKWDFKQALRDWIEQNTEEREVDAVSKRKEKVPNSNYRKAFPTLTPEQKEYYDTMMQIKGEIGSLLPDYARSQFLPPQLRREMLDALSDAKDAWDVLKAFRNKFEDIWKVREDDDSFAENGAIVDGNEYIITQGDWDNTKRVKIPIFYVNKVEQGELLKDFSSGISALCGTALNYSSMNDIAQVVEFMGNYVKHQKFEGPKAQAEMVEDAKVNIFRDLADKAKKNKTDALVNSFIYQHLYGQKLDPNQVGYKLSKFIKSLIGYTSVKGLATNVKGMISNYLVGEYQMVLEAAVGEFYNAKDYIWAHSRLFGDSGVTGEIAELLTNNKNHRSTLFREMFDPTDDQFQESSHKRYYTNSYPGMFRQLISKDCTFIGYKAGEYLIHYVNMYAMLNHIKVQHNGKLISLYDAFEVGNKQDGNSELVLKPGVTTITGEAITPEWIQKVKDRIRYVNQSCHGAMSEEDKGMIHQKLWGRMIMNFRQWMVEHYSRRFRGAHKDASLGEIREGYWVSYWKYLFNENTKEEWKSGKKIKVIGETVGELTALAFPQFMHDYMRFILRSQAQWDNMSEMQKYNIRRVHAEMAMFAALLGFSFALGEPEDHKKEFWYRMCIYQVRRMLVDAESGLPVPQAIKATTTILQSPMAGVSMFDNIMYLLYGLTNGDVLEDYKQGRHKGENKYWVNVKRRVLPYFKDAEQLEYLDDDESLFKVFD